MLTIYNFNLEFIYVFISGKISAHDCQIFNNAIENKRLCMLSRKYFLGNTKYYNIDFTFILYCNIYYSLKKYILPNY